MVGIKVPLEKVRLESGRNYLMKRLLNLNKNLPGELKIFYFNIINLQKNLTCQKNLIMGLPGAGKTTLEKALLKYLDAEWLNADKVRQEANDWDFSPSGRWMTG